VPASTRATEEPTGPGPGRREVLRLGLLGATGSLALTTAGCDIRLESAAPVTMTAGRVPAPDERLLLAALARATRLAALAEQAGRAEVAARHTEQARVCRSLLAAAGVPLPAEGSVGTVTSPSVSGAPSSGAPSAQPVTVAGLASAEAARDDLPWPVLAAAGPHRRLAVSLAAHDAATAAILGATVAWPPGSRVPAAVATAQLEPARAAAYGIEVATARLPADRRARLLETLTVLRHRAQRLSDAAGAAAGGPLAYTLPFPVDTPADAERLAAGVLAGLVSGGLAGLDDGPAPQLSVEAISAVVALLAEAVQLGSTWQVPQNAFPGLVVR
jgi:hypothetical protein